MAAVFLLRGAAQFGAGAIGIATPLHLLQRISSRSYSEILNAELKFVNQRERGNLMVMVADYPARANLAVRDLATVLSNGLVFIVYAALMVAVSWKLTLAACTFLFVLSLVLRGLFDNILGRAGARVSRAQADLQTQLQETFNGLKLIRLSVGESRMAERFVRTLRTMVTAQRHSLVLAEIPNPFFAAVSGIFICILLVGGAVMQGGVEAGWIAQLLLFLFLLSRLNAPVSTINLLRTRIISNLDAIARLEAFHEDAVRHREPDGGLPVAHFTEAIRFEGVSYTYDGGTRAAVDDVNLTINRGEIIAIVGPSGAGKSTVVGLLARLFDPTKGRILVDGRDLRELAVKDWRALIGTVSQDIFVFDDTVTSNLCFPKADAPAERVQSAVTLALADGFIADLPQGYDSRLGDRGARLSGGQQQRLAIARSIIANPDILILDEATSHLDSITETAIQHAIDLLSHRLTLVVIAHRLSTVRKADRIIVLDGGHVVEEGSHAELTLRRGRYWDLLSHQLLGLSEET